MKVLFAVNDEKSSAAIVKKYQKEYKEIISYKKVYYFNAILKELQRDKTYDRIVISEDLEEFSSTSYEQQDKYIFERLDNISDEASNAKGREVPIIVICSERRTKSEELLVKLFGIGIYNAIIGNDRSVDQVCRLLNKPRSKKDTGIMEIKPRTNLFRDFLLTQNGTCFCIDFIKGAAIGLFLFSQLFVCTFRDAVQRQ